MVGIPKNYHPIYYHTAANYQEFFWNFINYVTLGKNWVKNGNFG